MLLAHSTTPPPSLPQPPPGSQLFPDPGPIPDTSAGLPHSLSLVPFDLPEDGDMVTLEISDRSLGWSGVGVRLKILKGLTSLFVF